MWHPPRQKAATMAQDNLLGYVADLELEVDRLRKQSDVIQHDAIQTIKRVQQLCKESRESANPTSEIALVEEVIGEFSNVLRDLQELPGYHPANDQVIDIALRPLVEKVFRWHQRVLRVPHMQLNLELQSDSITWFPVRLRHILDNLISNALKFRDTNKGETRLLLTLTTSIQAYELRLTDNGLGLSHESREAIEDMLYHAVPARPLGVGVGLSVVRILVEQSGGKVTIDSTEGKSTSVAVVLPRFDADDFLS